MSCKVLIVEDDPITRAVLERVLFTAGVEVFAVEKGDLALALLSTQPVDLILLDIKLEGIDGWETASRIRKGEVGEHNARVPIIALTGYEEPEAYAQCQQMGLNGCLAKPFEPEELRQLVLDLCKGQPDMQSPGTQTYNLKEGSPLPSTDSLKEGPELYVAGLLRKYEGDRDMVGLLIETFRQDAPRKVKAMEASLQNQNWQELERVAHSLKGACGVLDWRSLQEIAYRLELCSKNR
ncbi:MAG: response regulator, partial [Spirochaetales bacterium]